MCTACASANFYSLNWNILEPNFPFTAGRVCWLTDLFQGEIYTCDWSTKSLLYQKQFLNCKCLKSSAAACCTLLITNLCCWWSWDHVNKGQLLWKGTGGSRLTGESTILYFCFFLNITSQPQPQSGSQDSKPLNRTYYGCSSEQVPPLLKESYLSRFYFFRLIQKRNQLFYTIFFYFLSDFSIYILYKLVSLKKLTAKRLGLSGHVSGIGTESSDFPAPCGTCAECRKKNHSEM